MSGKISREILDTTPAYLGKVSLRSQVIYMLILCFIIIMLAALPFIEFDISVSASGMIRPEKERTAIVALTSGQIKDLYFKQGKMVKQGDTLLALYDQAIQSRISFLNSELNRKKSLSRDLVKMIRNPLDISGIENPSNIEQLEHFIARKNELEIRKNKIQNELSIAKRLSKEKIIAPKEMEESQFHYNVSVASLTVHGHEQISKWEHSLLQTYQEIDKLRTELEQAAEELKLYTLIAPVSGTVEVPLEQFKGNQIIAGETILVISPDASLIAECFLSTKEIGFIKKGQPCFFQIDAFNYNHFGAIGGEIRSVGQDFIMIDNRPSYRVHCSLNKMHVELSNGYKSDLKKGMTFRVRFFITRRTAWQLIYDKVNDWVNPGSS